MQSYNARIVKDCQKFTESVGEGKGDLKRCYSSEKEASAIFFLIDSDL